MNTIPQPTQEQEKSLAEVLRTLGHPIRLVILRKLLPGPKCVNDMQELLDVSQPNLSQHLRLLRRENLVDFVENGKKRCYYLCRPQFVTQLFKLLESDFPQVQLTKDDVCSFEAQIHEPTTCARKEKNHADV